MAPDVTQPSLFGGEPQAVARATDPGTSWAAADSVEGIRPLQRAILRWYRMHGPATHETLVLWQRDFERHLQKRTTPQSLRTRSNELVKMGYVRDSGKKGLMATGRYGIEWEAVPEEDGSR